MWVLFAWLGSTALAMLDRNFGLTADANPLAMEGGLLSGLFSLATFVPTLALMARTTSRAVA